MGVLVVTGTGTEIGKTVVTAAVAALALAAGRRVAVLKPAQTGVAPGDAGDVAEVARLAGPVTGRELARYPEPLAPDTAARRCGLPPIGPGAVAEEAARLTECHDLVLVEGAGGLLVRYDDAGHTLADAARAMADRGLPVDVLAVAPAGLGTLNGTALTAEALRHRGLPLLGVVVGCWPAAPDLAARCNLADLPSVAGAPLLGALPEGCAAAGGAAFLATARTGLAPRLGGTWDAARFTAHHAPAPLPVATG
ncbi:dethiobiotin synthase [Peterkaempfera bronchialis]|uniref:ATP-dependent dethiobiotin synthetase BioD n=1 Tax=Peterkaempfera bronchialis TaxID=2126346 RepID=A0A345SRQ9_9ACTN|nr:dethiobiotin synthase [Peterkaempfera bronchialis]AXI76414.1 ATP-dependent dethiobiotin synthetase BioD [Peterkaempfera bronchialis]